MSSETDPTVCIVESVNLLQEDVYREGEIISRTLKLADKNSQYVYIRTERELRRAIEEFGNSRHRYLHISCHGSKQGFATTVDFIESQEFIELLAPVMKGRRLFVSSCWACTREFATELLDQSACLSVVGPVGTIYFDDAAIFWTSFYHLMFKRDPASMRSGDIEEIGQKCAMMIGQRFRLYRKRHNKVDGRILGPKLPVTKQTKAA